MSNEPPSPAAGELGELFVVSAPSAAGKTTIIRTLFRDYDFGGTLYYSVSHTTRAPRPGEVEGRDYHFIDEAAFRRMIDEDRFLEWAEVHGQLKGTAEAPIRQRLARGIDVLLDIDVQGAAQVRRRFPEAQSIFIMPPSFAELRRRLLARGLDDPEQIERRLRQASVEMRCYRHYRYVMINDHVERASRVLAAVIYARRHRRERIQRQIDRVMADVPAVAERATRNDD
ncbi:MAG: guanylate kinase [Acidobacteria bacterium]|nr:MAG: guanylate kinase [Acidobacteriota bacterium]